MNRQRKALTATKGLSQKTYRNYIIDSARHEGRYNDLPSEDEIVEGYFTCLEFYREREGWHQQTADWYFNYAREMQANAYGHLDKAKLAKQQGDSYLDLIGTAYLNGFSFHQGVQNVE